MAQQGVDHLPAALSRRATHGVQSAHVVGTVFLDEATAFAAGHRPCAYCRRERYNEFKLAWCAANNAGLNLPATAIDARLHTERVAPGGGKHVVHARFGGVPDGAFVVLDGAPALLWRGRLFGWSHTGYAMLREAPADDTHVGVLTPASIVAMFRAGFRPQVHLSAWN